MRRFTKLLRTIALCVLLLLSPSTSWAAIAFLGINSGSGSGSSFTISWTGTAGHSNIIAIGINSSSVTVTSVTDTGGSTYTKAGGVTLTATRTELWYTTSTAFSGSITVTLSGSASAAAVSSEYSGVLGYGSTATNSGTAADPTINLATQDNNNYVAAAMGMLTSTAATAKTGNLRGNSGIGNVDVAANDNTSASPSTLTNAVTKVATDWGAVALELRTVAGAVGGNRSLLGVVYH